jgi:dehydrogenase/reductase SDR family protein 7B
MEYYENKVVLVTGAGSGLGLSIVKQLECIPNCRILASGRSHARMTETFRDYPHIETCCIDLEWDDGKILEAVGKIHDRHGRIDILVNCAGMGFRGQVVDTTLEVDRRIMQVDYFGQVAVIKGVLGSNRMKGLARCHILQVSSVQGYFGMGDRAPYSAAKHALVGFIDSLRAEIDTLNDKSEVFVTMVSPGYIATNHSCNAVTADGAIYSRNDETTAEGWSPDEVAHKALLAAACKEREVVLADVKIKFLVFIRCLFATLCFRLIRNRQMGRRESVLKTVLMWLVGIEA